MLKRLRTPIRYQLNKEATKIVKSNHPWIFRSKLNCLTSNFKTGQWLRLFDQDNTTLGYGVFDKSALIGIRVLSLKIQEPIIDSIEKHLIHILSKRKELRKFTNSFRAIHGENDGFPGIVIDVYQDTGVLQTYSTSVDLLGRLLAQKIQRELKLKTLLWKIPSKSSTAKVDKPPIRILRGSPSGVIKIQEGKLDLYVDPWSGQKSGAFLDLRGLRKWIGQQKLNGKKVLNLFSYTGSLAIAAELAGASEIWNVEISQGALDTGKKYHAKDIKKHKFIKADVFKWIQTLSNKHQFDLIIVDPPNMASHTQQTKKVLRTYKKLFKAAAMHLKPYGKIAVCCCTSRIERHLFIKTAKDALSPRKMLLSLNTEQDHPIGFPEGDYLKILIFSN